MQRQSASPHERQGAGQQAVRWGGGEIHSPSCWYLPFSCSVSAPHMRPSTRACQVKLALGYCVVAGGRHGARTGEKHLLRDGHVRVRFAHLPTLLSAEYEERSPFLEVLLGPVAEHGAEVKPRSHDHGDGRAEGDEPAGGAGHESEQDEASMPLTFRLVLPGRSPCPLLLHLPPTTSTWLRLQLCPCPWSICLSCAQSWPVAPESAAQTSRAHDTLSLSGS